MTSTALVRFDAVRRMRFVSSLVLGLLFSASAFAAGAVKKNFDVPADTAVRALRQFAAQSGEQLLYTSDDLRDVRTLAVKGAFTPREALEKMLAGTPLVVAQDKSTGALAVRRDADPNDPRAAQSDSDRPDQAKVEDGKLVLDRFEVLSRKTLNMDLPRSRDDALPYVVFDRQAIAHSGVANLEEFFRQRLTMESTALSESQTPSNLGGRSTINLRGLGANQTLILVDGHRMSGVVSVGAPSQPDLNGIPLSAVERIEILPTSASAIYGGSATGGVVNIVLRRDYAGVETKLTYGNTFDTDAATRQFDLSAGATLFGGKTTLLFAASVSDANRLLAQDRDLRARGVARILANNPSYFTASPVPPVGSTSNIRSTNGQNLVLDNNTALGSPFTFVPHGYAGAAGDGGAAFVANAGSYNLESARTVTSGQQALLAAPERQSAMLTVRHDFSSTVQAFLELSGSNSTSRYPSANTFSFTLPGDNPHNPFQQAIRITTPFYGVDDLEGFTRSKERRLVAGAIVELPGEWKGEIDFTRHEATLLNQRLITSDAATAAATDAVRSGTLDLLRDTTIYPVDFRPYFDEVDGGLASRSVNWAATARASGPVGKLPAGRPVLSTLLEQRDQKYGGPGSGTAEPQTQRVRSVYMEAVLPLVAREFNWPGMQELELHLAGRWDGYRTFGMSVENPFFPSSSGRNKFDSTNPSVALRWVVNPSVMLRASYGTGFLPPDVNQLAPITFPSFGFYQDPRRGNEELGFFDEIFGGNANLKPEKSKTWSAGLVFTPAAITGLRFSVDWTRIEKTDNIASADPFDLLAHESDFPGRIVRGPVPAGDPYGVGPIIAIDESLINLARATAESIDLSLDYTRKFAFGRIDAFAMATYAVSYETQLQAGAPVEQHVGRGNSAQSAAGGGAFPTRWRANAGVTWTRGRVQAGWSARYIDDYLLDSLSATTLLAQGHGGRVSAQLYHDVFVGYTFGPPADGGWWGPLLAGTEVRLAVKNIFNTEPPFDASNTANYYSGYGDPRLASYTLTLTHRF